jgi:hypothetical protein
MSTRLPSPAARSLAPWLISLAIHAALLMGGFFIVWSVAAPARDYAPASTVAFFDPAPAGDVATYEGPPESRLETLARVMEPAEQPEPKPAAAPTLTPVELEPLPTPDLSAFDPTARRDVQRERRFPRVRFFGLGSSDAQSIVYVVDASGSTVSTLPAIRRELMRSLSRLDPTQEVQVILFGGSAGDYRAAPHPLQPERDREVRLIRATSSNVASLMEWIGAVRSEGRCDPSQAMIKAVGLNPDAIFLLATDLSCLGDYAPPPEEILGMLEMLNPTDRDGDRRTTINTVQLGRATANTLLEDIAQIHGGPNAHVTLDERELELIDSTNVSPSGTNGR